MSRTSSQTINQTPVVVSFDPSCGLEPLTCQPKTVADDVELYLQRVSPGPLAVSFHGETRGLVLGAGSLVATFVIAPLGGVR